MSTLLGIHVRGGISSTNCFGIRFLVGLPQTRSKYKFHRNAINDSTRRSVPQQHIIPPHQSPAKQSHQPNNSGPNFHQPNTTLRIGFITACSVVFLLWQVAEPRSQLRPFVAPILSPIVNIFFRMTTTELQISLRRDFTLSTGDVGRRPWTLVTNAFSHVDFFHLLFNMITLSTMVQIMGRAVRPGLIAPLMLGSAVSGSMAYIYQERSRNRVSRAMGASAVVSGLGVATALLYPHMPIALFGVVELPLWIATAGFLAIDTYNLENAGSSIGHSAHLGGGIFGAVFYAVFLRRYGGVLRRF